MRASFKISHPIYVIILCSLMAISGSFPLVTPIGCESRLVTLYNSTTELPASTTSNFTNLFNTSFTNAPIITISNAGYYSLDQLYNQLWGITYTLFVNLTGMQIHARVETNTRTNILFISYFAVDPGFQPGLFQMFQVQYLATQLVNTSVGTGSRVDRFYYQPTPVTYFNPSSQIYHTTNVLHMRNTGTFGFVITVQAYVQFNTTINQTYCTTFLITINSTQTRLETVGLWIIIINPNKISYENYYRCFTGSITVTSTSTSYTYYDINVTSSSVGELTANIQEIHRANMIMGFSTWGSDPYLGSAFRWTLTNDTNGTYYVKIFNNNRIGRIKYNFLIFGQVDCPQLWSVANQSCVSTCASNDVLLSDRPVCRPCSTHCTTCSILPRNCTSCQSGYYLANNTCLICNASLNLTQCGYVPPVPPGPEPSPQPTPTPTPTPIPIPVVVQHSPYWIACLSIIPLLALGIYCYCRYKKMHATIAIEKASSFKQHPSIQF